VFSDQPNLKFIYGDFCSDVLQELCFDIIVFAGSIQYFPSLTRVLEKALQQLWPGGEIHVLDSRLYRHSELEMARRSARTCYDGPGMSEAASPVFHPCLDELALFNHRYLYNPFSIWNQLFGPRGAHPWIKVIEETDKTA
jgi:SAM-dependent methyltransferase